MLGCGPGTFQTVLRLSVDGMVVVAFILAYGTVWIKLDEGTDPSPTIVRSVSGNEIRISTSHSPEQITKNQKIDRHPRLEFNAAAMTGPVLGAVFVLVQGG